MSCGELDPVRIRTPGAGSSVSSSAAASKPSMTGMLMSSATTSGRSRRASSTASFPSDARPTTSIRSSVASMAWSASAKRR
jgi:hypothetical protein